MKFKHFETSLDKEREYPKLVRDGIPEIVKADKGIDAKIRVLEDDEEYLAYLLKKVEEEADELTNAESKEHIVEEMADVLEVMDAILKFNDIDIEIVKKVQIEKVEKRGGFEKRLLMLEEVK